MENILSNWLSLLSNLAHRNKINKQAKAIIINSLAIKSKIKVSEIYVMRSYYKSIENFYGSKVAGSQK